MMELRVLGSSSSGNCYLLDNGRECLILEAGVAPTQVKKALGYDLRKVVGCVVTHEHGDHAKHVRAMLDFGFHVLALPEVWGKVGERGPRAVAIRAGRGYRLGRFKVLPFPSVHDVPCVGYHVSHPECGNLLFLTDSCECTVLFSNLNHVMIECNYSTPRLIDAVNEGRTMRSQIDRLPQSHMELQKCKAVLSETDLSAVQEVVLLHLSGQNSDPAQFVDEVERSTGKAVYTAKPGLVLDITKF